MSPQPMVRRLSPPMVMLAMVMSVLGITAAPAYAQYVVEPLHRETFTYDCLQGQTVGVDTGVMRSMVTDPETGAPTEGGEMKWVVLTIQPSDSPTAAFEDGGAPPPGTTSYDFAPVYGMALTPSKTLYIDRQMQHEGEGIFAEYERSFWWCEGEPTDTDADGVPDELDACPDVVGTEPNGCPPQPGSPVVNVVSTTAAHDGTSDGSVTVSVTNTVDVTAASVTYAIHLNSNIVQEGVGPLADGETSQTMTFASASGSFPVCASGDDGSWGCAEVTVAQDPTQAHAGKVTFQDRCGGVYTTITNDGWQVDEFFIENRDINHGFIISSVRKSLAPGESVSLLSGRRFYFRSYAYREGGSAGDTLLGKSTWQVPDDCVPMRGGTELLSWGHRLTKHRSTPVVTVKTVASHTRLGVKIKGDPVVHWRYGSVSPGKHRLKLYPVKRGTKQCFQVWAAYTDGFYTVGRGPVSRWHCYRRP